MSIFIDNKYSVYKNRHPLHNLAIPNHLHVYGCKVTPQCKRDTARRKKK